MKDKWEPQTPIQLFAINPTAVVNFKFHTGACILCIFRISWYIRLQRIIYQPQMYGLVLLIYEPAKLSAYHDRNEPRNASFKGTMICSHIVLGEGEHTLHQAQPLQTATNALATLTLRLQCSSV
jgi:hypothetical protein